MTASVDLRKISTRGPGPKAKSALAEPAHAGWLSDFTWTDGVIEVRKTGVRLRIDLNLVHEVIYWAMYLLVLGAAMMLARLQRKPALAIWYAPDRPRPWYLLHGAALWGGMRAARGPAQANAAFYFDDTTRGAAPAAGELRVFNARCTDISKSHVAKVFAEVFGYPLLLDPQRSVGEIVQKAEKNGVHNGRVVQAPLPPKAGYVYQRLVDTADAQGMAHDLRTPCVAGRPVLVWEKIKPAGQRFAIHNERAVLRDPAEVFSEGELELIAVFIDRMGLDWGGLDILRDRHGGRIYIVDVNKTDLGPVIALSWADKIRSMNRLSRALSGLIQPDK